MKKTKTKLFQLVIILSSMLYAQEPYPLQVGNSWATRDYFFRPDYKLTVIDSCVIINNSEYFKIQSLNAGIPITEFIYYSRLREDGYYISFDSVNFFERIYFKENPQMGDYWYNEYPGGYRNHYTVIDTGYYLIFGRSTKTFLVFVTDSMLSDDEHYWSEDFGLLQYTVEDPFAGNLYWLSGCVINGIVYGDTSLTPVSVSEADPPLQEFLLRQNYPNPFNPITNISFYLPQKLWVKLKVFNVLGNEITQLLNEEMESGNNQVVFSGSGLSSGIYFYKLIAGDYVETKKMILIR